MADCTTLFPSGGTGILSLAGVGQIADCTTIIPKKETCLPSNAGISQIAEYTTILSSRGTGILSIAGVGQMADCTTIPSVATGKFSIARIRDGFHISSIACVTTHAALSIFANLAREITTRIITRIIEIRHATLSTAGSLARKTRSDFAIDTIDIQGRIELLNGGLA